MCLESISEDTYHLFYDLYEACDIQSPRKYHILDIPTFKLLERQKTLFVAKRYFTIFLSWVAYTTL